MSSYRSIYEQAVKQLEFAGKEGHIDYIKQHHQKMIQEYDRIMSALRSVPLLRPEEEEAEENLQQELRPLSSEEFQQKIMAMEDAMCALDGQKLLEILEELQGCSYFEKALKKLLVPVKRKIEMSDYVSAVEMLTQIQKELTDKEETS